MKPEEVKKDVTEENKINTNSDSQKANVILETQMPLVFPMPPPVLASTEVSAKEELTPLHLEIKPEQESILKQYMLYELLGLFYGLPYLLLIIVSCKTKLFPSKRFFYVLMGIIVPWLLFALVIKAKYIKSNPLEFEDLKEKTDKVEINEAEFEIGEIDEDSSNGRKMCISDRDAVISDPNIVENDNVEDEKKVGPFGTERPKRKTSADMSKSLFYLIFTSRLFARKSWPYKKTRQAKGLQS